MKKLLGLLVFLVTIAVGATTGPLNPTKISWTDPTVNTDGSPISTGEITGYLIGARNTAATGSVPGIYPYTIAVSSPTATTATISQFNPALPYGVYAIAIQTTGPNPSAWSAELNFVIAAVPTAPNGLTVQ